MKKGRFLWSAHRITEKQKAGKARNIKGKQLKNSRSTASKPPVARLSSANVKAKKNISKVRKFKISGPFCIPKTPGYAGEFRKSFSGEHAIKTPFAIFEVRSGNCAKEAKGGHPK